MKPSCRWRVLPSAFAVAFAAAVAAASAADAAAGREKAKSCTPCHGPVGMSMAPDAPNLAGQVEPYLAAQLHAYRSGRRTHEVMTLMAKPLSDTDIDNLAAWFSSIRIEVKQAPR